MKKIPELLFGSPGIPSSTEAGQGERNTANGVKQCRKLGLDAMELEWVQSINISKERAPEIKKVAEENNITLTCHGQYFVNLSPTDMTKLKPSMQRMREAAERMHEVNGWSITWHTAFYLGRGKPETYEIVKKNFKSVVKDLHDRGLNNVWLRPETTGKESQWGDLQECIKLSQDIEGVLPCIDFAHLHARYNGINNTTEEFRAIMNQLEKGLGRECLNNMHIQICNIEYTPKGERRHLNLQDTKQFQFNWKDLLKVWKEYKIKGVVIDESPNIEEDALLLQKHWKAL
ncbi:MAG TPA: TIM barrel protein [Candidatus Binatia bacterium]|nr:TIM barrel protein [Candidatus Binatia bacterium]